MHQVTDRIRRSVRRRNRYNIRKDTADLALLLPINRRRILYQNKNQQNRLEYMRRQYAEIENEPSLVLSSVLAVIYVISGAIQPLLMYLVKDIGLSDPHCQLYMVAYYIGPTCLGFTLRNDQNSSVKITKASVQKSASIACLDVLAQSINYTGAIMCGPTIFSIVYSSVTVWTAVQSRVILRRELSPLQWVSVIFVFIGLLLLKDSATENGEHVYKGAVLAIVGSMLHALTYVMSEIVMTSGEKVAVRVNCFIQGAVACTAFMFWQIIYTSQHYHNLIQKPMIEANASYAGAARVLFFIASTNLIHALTFFHTLRHFPGGATSAGLMKGLQAVLVFVLTSVVFCGRRGGNEMCFTENKFISLVVVIGGVFMYGLATAKRHSSNKEEQNYLPDTKQRYQQI